ncbi:phage holin family protein [Enterobacter soli]|uniref:phage holin family protein n=1 Tax=Enterobacter soli TaxID=885040 RepID=UPI003EDB1486
MQNFTPPSGSGPVLHFLNENSLALQGALTVFFIALLFSLWDGVAWRRSFTAGFICGFVALAVVSFLNSWAYQTWIGLLSLELLLTVTVILT